MQQYVRLLSRVGPQDERAAAVLSALFAAEGAHSPFLPQFREATSVDDWFSIEDRARELVQHAARDHAAARRDGWYAWCKADISKVLA